MANQFVSQVPIITYVLNKTPTPEKIYIGDYPMALSISGHGYLYVISNTPDASIALAASGEAYIYVTGQAGINQFDLSTSANGQIDVSSASNMDLWLTLDASGIVYVNSDVSASLEVDVRSAAAINITGQADSSLDVSIDSQTNEVNVICQANACLVRIAKFGDWCNGIVTFGDMCAKTFGETLYTVIE